MCFKPDPNVKKPRRNWGYKAFYVTHDGSLCGEYAGQTKERKYNTWLCETAFRPTDYEKYVMSTSPLMGWRIFLFKKGAQKWANRGDWHGFNDLKVVKVRFRDILSVGICEKEKAIVAKEIFIPK